MLDGLVMCNLEYKISIRLFFLYCDYVLVKKLKMLFVDFKVLGTLSSSGMWSHSNQSIIYLLVCKEAFLFDQFQKEFHELLIFYKVPDNCHTNK